MVFSVTDNKKVIYHHYGKKMNNYQDFQTAKYMNRPDTHQSFAPELYPAYGGRHYLEPALQITHPDGVLTTDLYYKSHEVKCEKDGVVETIVTLKDNQYPLIVQVYFRAYMEDDIICQHIEVINAGKKPIHINRISSAFLPLQADRYYLTHFHGTWANEMQMVEEELLPGLKIIESKKGVRTTQSEAPSFILSINKPAVEESGEVYAGCLAWSGNYSLSFELDEAGFLNILGGVNSFLSDLTVLSGSRFTTPEMILSYSKSGKGELSRNFHDWTRKYALMHGFDERPIVLNSWEGAYFDFKEETIVQMIDKAAEFGVEMFVLDDGWFGNKYPRNGDNAGLGDWQTNLKKLPHGLNYLAEYAHNKGLKFGIWIEPEMVNPASELAEKHPEWIVKSGKREMLTMRNQWLLDLCNPMVQDYIVKTVDDVIANSPFISYIKWDANRHVDNVGSEYLASDKQSHFWIDYTKGLYNVYERIRLKHPDIMIQLCSSGGGRVDFGALKYHDEFWASDNTDPLSRLFIQYGNSHFFPANAIASHVSTSPNHQTGLVTPLKFRFDVAMSGRLGLELQPKDIVGDDIEFTKKAINNYKQIRPIVQQGDLYRLYSPYDQCGWSSHLFVSKDTSSAVLFAYSLKYHNRTMVFKPKLSGLQPTKRYKVTELNKQYDVLLEDNSIYTGEYLQSVGLSLTIRKPLESAVILLTEI